MMKNDVVHAPTSIDQLTTTMASSARAPPIFLPSILLFLVLLTSSHGANTVLCNDNSYSDIDPFGPNREDLLQALVWLTPWSPNRDVYSGRPYTGPIVFGHAACRPGLVDDDCKFCLGNVVTLLEQTCGHRLGGRAAQGDDCRIRYEQYVFTD